MEPRRWSCGSSGFRVYSWTARTDGAAVAVSVITYDTLVRAGVSATSVYVPAGSAAHEPGIIPVAICSRGVKITPDTTLQPSNLGPDKYDLLVVPGGAKGAETISGNTSVQHLVKEYFEQGKLVAMICAGEWQGLGQVSPGTQAYNRKLGCTNFGPPEAAPDLSPQRQGSTSERYVRIVTPSLLILSMKRFRV
jgi:putative intracellular protease/amidase